MNNAMHTSLVRTVLTRSIALAVACGALTPLTANAAEPASPQDMQSARSLSRAFNRVAKSAELAVVHISAIRREPEMISDGWFVRPSNKLVERAVGFGSGVIVDASGIILTNNGIV